MFMAIITKQLIISYSKKKTKEGKNKMNKVQFNYKTLTNQGDSCQLALLPGTNNLYLLLEKSDHHHEPYLLFPEWKQR